MFKQDNIQKFCFNINCLNSILEQVLRSAETVYLVITYYLLSSPILNLLLKLRVTLTSVHL